MTIANLRRLAAIINGALDTLESELATAALDFPALDEPYDSAAPVERVLEEEAAADAVDLIVAASSQLCASVRKPTVTMVDTAWQVWQLIHQDDTAFSQEGQHMLPVALYFLSTLDVVEILADAGQKGMHARDIASKADVDFENVGTYPAY